MKNYILTLSSLFVATALIGCQSGPSNKYYDSRYDNDPHAMSTLLTNESSMLSGHDVEILAVIPLPEEELQIIQPEIVESETRTFVISSDLLFDFDKSELKESSHYELNKFLNQIVEQFNSIESIAVEGYTDRFGTEQYNYKLGFDRATNVRNALVGYGLPEGMMSVGSFGETQPVTDGCFNVGNRPATKACLAPDRRVEIKVLGTAVVAGSTPSNTQPPSTSKLNTPNMQNNAPGGYNAPIIQNNAPYVQMTPSNQ